MLKKTEAEEYIMRLALIDIDNTLLDFDEYVRQTMQSGFAHFGLRPYEPFMYDVFERENNELWRALERSELTFAELKRVRWNSIFAALGIEFDGAVFEEYFRAALHESAIAVDGARDMLSALSERMPLYAASNGPFEQQMHRLAIADMAKYFTDFFISERIGASKPSRAFFDYAFDAINAGREAPIQPHEAVIIGDSLTSDMAGGLQYGLKTCYYRRKGAAPAGEGIDLTVTDLRDIAKLIL